MSCTHVYMYVPFTHVNHVPFTLVLHVHMTWHYEQLLLEGGEGSSEDDGLSVCIINYTCIYSNTYTDALIVRYGFVSEGILVTLSIFVRTG